MMEIATFTLYTNINVHINTTRTEELACLYTLILEIYINTNTHTHMPSMVCVCVCVHMSKYFLLPPSSFIIKVEVVFARYSLTNIICGGVCVPKKKKKSTKKYRSATNRHKDMSVWYVAYTPMLPKILYVCLCVFVCLQKYQTKARNGFSFSL